MTEGVVQPPTKRFDLSHKDAMLLHIHTCLTRLFQQAKVQLAIIITSETGQATNLTISLGTSVVVLDPKAHKNPCDRVPRIT